MNAPTRILVIDDTPAIHDDFRKIFCPAEDGLSPRDEAAFFGEELPSLTGARFALEFASQGAEGCALLERALAEGRAPAIAFVDVRMPPGMDGIETAERLWQLSPELQVVICTAYSDYSWEEMIAKLGQRDRLLILKKPFATIEVLQLACALGEKWELTRRAGDHLAETERAVEQRTRELREANQQLAAEMAQRKVAEQHLLRAQRLESIGTLASGIAHDLNNMLSPILLSAQLLHHDWPPETHRELVCTIENSAGRAAGIVRQVLTFARGIDGERVPLQPKQFVREIEKIITETFPQNITIESELAPDLWLIEGDATQLHQILMNLCVNARDAMPEGGTLRLAGENFEADTHYASMIPGARAGQYVKLRVSDTGTGIPPELIEKIFDPFFTTKPLGKGTGLGLSTVAGIVKSHEGFIDLQSEPGKGTSFEIFMPAARESAPAVVAPAEIAAPDGHGELILVVDDEAEIRSVMQSTLTSRGYRVVTAADGAEALAIYVPLKSEIAAVVTDLNMPIVDGVALCRALRKMDARICIIASTGSVDALRAQVLQSLGVGSVLSKPFHANALLTALEAALALKHRRKILAA